MARPKPNQYPHCPTCQGISRTTTNLVCMTCGRDYAQGPNPHPAIHEGWRATHRLIDCWCEPVLEDIRIPDGAVVKVFKHQGSTAHHTVARRNAL